MISKLAIVISLILLTNILDTGNHLGLKVCADAAGMETTGVRSLARFGARILSMPLAWLSISLGLLSLFIWVYALTMAELSLAFSLDSMHHIFIAVAARRFLKEKVGWRRWTGTLCIMTGIIIVAASGMQ